MEDTGVTQELFESLHAEVIHPPTGLVERGIAAYLRGFLRVAFRTLIGPPQGAAMQRFVVGLMSPLMPGVGGVRRENRKLSGLPIQRVIPPNADRHRAILYLHGGAFCLGSPDTHRSITTRLARETGQMVWVPDYRLAPEHPYPAALDDAIDCYRAIMGDGHPAANICVAGDSAGGSLALALCLALRQRGLPLPGKLALISPVTDMTAQGESIQTCAHSDPMLRIGWLEQAMRWYRCPDGAGPHAPLQADLSGFPPMLVQVGDQEILLSDSLRLTERARLHGVDVKLQVYKDRWHVFHLQSAWLASSREAISEIARFCKNGRATAADTAQAGRRMPSLSDA